MSVVRKQRGFTLIELLIVVAIIGLLASMMIPNLLDALQKAKQKRTVADMRIIGTGMMSWLTDQASAAAAGAASTSPFPTPYQTATVEQLQVVLVSQYVQAIPVLDGWKSPYRYYLNTTRGASQHVMAIHSLGRDKVADTGTLTVSGFDPTDYDRDIVWTDGFFVRWPQK